MEKRCFLFGVPIPGGTRTWALGLRRALAPHGWSVEALDVAVRGPDPASMAELDGLLPCHVLGEPDDTWPRAVDRLARYLSDAGPCALIADRGFLFPFLPPNVARVGICHGLSRAALRWVIEGRPGADRYVAISPAVRDRLRTRVGDQSRITLVPHGVPALADHPRTYLPSPIRLLTVGRLEDAEKGVMDIPRIGARLADTDVAFRWTVAGDGPDRERLVAALRRAGLDGLVSLSGWRPAEELPDLYRAHDVLVVPSRLEGLGYALVEAMSAALVPVASLLHGVTDFATADGVCALLCPPGDSDAFAASIRRLVRSPDLFREKSRHALDRARSEFSLERMGARYRELLDQLTAPGFARPRTLSVAKLRRPSFAKRWTLGRFVPGTLRRGLRKIRGN
jgi:glycosyltransferase involved in cell wall biosynthesis